MEQRVIIDRIAHKIQSLSDKMSEMQHEISRYQAENEQLHRLTKALQSQVSELQKENQELTFHHALKAPTDQVSKEAAQQRINALVKEIDECIQLLQH